MPHDSKPDLQDAKQQITIPWLWRYYGYPGEPRSSCRSPFREDKSPSFSITADGQHWKDFGTGDSGDPIDFIAQAEGLDNKQACRRILELAGHPSAPPLNRHRPVGNLRQQAATDQFLPPQRLKGTSQLRRGTERTLQQLLALRHFPLEALPGLQLLQDRSMLRFAERQGHVFWMVCDETFGNIQERRLDGTNIETADGNAVKARTWPGARASWPLGLEQAQRFPRMLIVEGGPDLLAAASLTAMLTPELVDETGFLAITGAANRLPQAYLAGWKEKTVTIFEHADRAGKRAANRWREDLNQVGCHDLLTFRFIEKYDQHGGPIGDLADALAALSDLPPTLLERIIRALRRAHHGTA